MRFLLALLILTNAAWLALAEWQTARYAEAVKTAEGLYYENYANDHAATECAVQTGYRYSCADGSRKVSCQ